MARTEECEITTMCMVYDGNGNILVQDRKNHGWTGVTFPGGHVEKGESFVHAAIREVKEETGLDVTDLKLCGIKQFPCGKEHYRYIVFFYKTCSFKGELKSSDEGEIFWIKREDLNKYRLADGFEGMLEIFEDDNISENYWYVEDGKWYNKNI